MGLVFSSSLTPDPDPSLLRVTTVILDFDQSRFILFELLSNHIPGMVLSLDSSDLRQLIVVGTNVL